jgi:hypothetical protein
VRSDAVRGDDALVGDDLGGLDEDAVEVLKRGARGRGVESVSQSPTQPSV